jgi:hypothetical protein
MPAIVAALLIASQVSGGAIFHSAQAHITGK